MWRNGRRNGLKIRWPERAVRVRVPPSAGSLGAVLRLLEPLRGRLEGLLSASRIVIDKYLARDVSATRAGTLRLPPTRPAKLH